MRTSRRRRRRTSRRTTRNSAWHRRPSWLGGLRTGWTKGEGPGQREYRFSNGRGASVIPYAPARGWKQTGWELLPTVDGRIDYSTELTPSRGDVFVGSTAQTNAALDYLKSLPRASAEELRLKDASPEELHSLMLVSPARTTDAQYRLATLAFKEWKRRGLQRNGRRTSRNPERRRTSRNPVPPAPSHSNWRAWWQWVSTTFAPGTTVMVRETVLGYVHTPAMQPKYVLTTVDVPAGSKGQVTELSGASAFTDAYMRVEFSPSAYVPAGTWAILYLAGRDRDEIEHVLQPLDDNWGQPPRPLGRQHLPTSQRSWLKPNIPLGSLAVPEPPEDAVSYRDWKLWTARTFAAGTPVALLRSDLAMFRARGVVQRQEMDVASRLIVVVKITDARDNNGIPVSSLLGREYFSFMPTSDLEPMVDNWAGQPQRMHRWQLPRTQRSWLKPNVARRGLEAAVETMRLYLGSIDRTAVRDQQRLFTRVTRAVADVATANGMRVEDVWEQVEREARKRGVRLAVPGKDI